MTAAFVEEQRQQEKLNEIEIDDQR